MKRSSVQFYSKQRHITSLLDDTDYTRNLYQQRYWMWWRDDLHKTYPTSHELPKLKYDIHNRIYAHKRQKWRYFVETLDQKTDVTKLWRTIKGIDDRAKRDAENEAITFNGSSFSSSKQLIARFNQQFKTSKLGRHTSTSETRLVTMETKRKSLEIPQTFTTDLVSKGIKSCRNSKAFGPDKLSIFHDLSDSIDMEVKYRNMARTPP